MPYNVVHTILTRVSTPEHRYFRIYIGRIDITANFTRRQTARVTGHKGLRKISYRSELYTSTLTAKPTYDGQSLQCVVTVPGLQSNISTVKLRVRC